MANQLIGNIKCGNVQAMTIDPETQVLQYKWSDLPQSTQGASKHHPVQAS
jgi:hypothetical protein